MILIFQLSFNTEEAPAIEIVQRGKQHISWTQLYANMCDMQWAKIISVLLRTTWLRYRYRLRIPYIIYYFSPNYSFVKNRFRSDHVNVLDSFHSIFFYGFYWWWSNTGVDTDLTLNSYDVINTLSVTHTRAGLFGRYNLYNFYHYNIMPRITSLCWLYQSRGVLNHRQRDCLFNSLFGFKKIKSPIYEPYCRTHRSLMDSPHNGPVMRQPSPWHFVCMILRNLETLRAHVWIITQANDRAIYCVCWIFMLISTLWSTHWSHFSDDIFKRVFMNEKVRISIKISWKLIPIGPIYNE